MILAFFVVSNGSIYVYLISDKAPDFDNIEYLILACNDQHAQFELISEGTLSFK